MNTNAEIKRLEGLKKIMQAARNVEHDYPGIYVDGINAGLQIALNAIENELTLARKIEEAIAIVNQ